MKRPVAYLLLAVILLASCSTSNGSGHAIAARVAPDLPATLNDLSNPVANNSPSLMADPTDVRFVVMANRLDGPSFGCALQASGDGGRHFIPANPVPHLPPGAEKCYAPDVAFDRKGVLYYLFIGLHTLGNTPMGVFLTRSSDRGRTFGVPHQVLGPNNFAVRMALDASMGDKGRINLVWLAASAPPALGALPAPPNPIMAMYSDDAGMSFSSPVQVSDASRSLVVAPALALGPHHEVDVLYYDLGTDQVDYRGLEGPTWEGKWSIVLASSSDGGGHFGPGRVVDDRVVPPERVLLIFTMPPPSVVVDSSGRVFVAWYDARNGDWDAFLRRSADGGRTWSAPRRLNDDPVRDGRNQYQPRLSIAPDGRVDAVFYDRRGDPVNGHNDVFFTWSVDHGATFQPNVKLTSQGSDSQFGPRYLGAAAQGLAEFGSTMGLLSMNDKAVAAWTDTRNDFLPESQDIFSTTVDFTPGPG